MGISKERLNEAESGMERERLGTNTIIARPEACGLLLWSYTKDSYFLLTDKNAFDLTKKVIRKQIRLEDIGNVVLQNELASIGCSAGTEYRFIENPHSDLRLSAPLDVYLDFTWKCNLKCPDCYNRNANRKITMSDENVRHIFNEMASAGVMRTHLAGGEPTIFPEKLKNYLAAANENRIRASLTTNGTLFTDEVAKIVFSYNLASLSFSVDGSSASLNDKSRGKGSFDKTTAAVRKAVEYKRKLGSETPIQIKTTWNPFVDESEFGEMVNLGISLGVNDIQFNNPEKCVYHEHGYFKQYRDQYYAGLGIIKELESKYGSRIAVWNVCNPLGAKINIGLPDVHGCIGGRELITINPDGSIRPCDMNPLILGNLFTDWDGSLLKFWNQSENLREFQSDLDVVDTDCAGCNLYNQCRGGSKVRSIVESGDVFQKDPYCPTGYVRDNHLKIDTNVDVKSKKTYLQKITLAHSL